MNRWLILPLCAALLASCSARGPQTLGTSFQGDPVPIAAARQTNNAAPVILDGAMIEKCPVAGCWFVLRDKSGTIKVDTKAAGFVVAEVPVNTRLTVAGRIVTNGDERLIEATGVRY